jgi:hypothetical protein
VAKDISLKDSKRIYTIESIMMSLINDLGRDKDISTDEAYKRVIAIKKVLMGLPP